MAKGNGKQSSDSVRPAAGTMFAERVGDLMERILQRNPNYTLDTISRKLKDQGIIHGVSVSSLSGARHGHRFLTEKVLNGLCDLAEVDRVERLDLLKLRQNARGARRNKAERSAELASEMLAVQAQPLLPARDAQITESTTARVRSFPRGRWSKHGLAVTAVCALLIAPEAVSPPSPKGQDFLPAVSGCSMGQRIPLVKIQGPAVRPPDVYLRACVEPMDGGRVIGVVMLEYIDGESYEAKVDWRVELRPCSDRREVLVEDRGAQDRFHNESPFKRDTDPLGWNGGVRAKARVNGIFVRDSVGTQWESSEPAIMETPRCSRPPTPPGSSAEPSVRPG